MTAHGWTSLNDDTKSAFVDRSAKVGLALSGGGIRSATLSLGLIEALASRGRFYGFDFMSTVSGGGYCGSFVRSLFVERDEGDGLEQNQAILNDRFAFADATLCSFPDQQFFRSQSGSSTFLKDGSAIKNPLWWLRENGRYLAPGGMSDYGYALSYMIRNWMTLLLFLTGVITIMIAALQLLEIGLLSTLEQDWQALPSQLDFMIGRGVRSPFVESLGMLSLVGTGIAGAYWLSLPLPYARSLKTDGASASNWRNRGRVAVRAAIVTSLTVVLAVMAVVFVRRFGMFQHKAGVASAAATAFAVVVAAGLVSACYNLVRSGFRHVDFRREQTRWLGGYNVIFVAACALALIDTIAFALLDRLGSIGGVNLSLSSAALVSVSSFLVVKVPGWIGKEGSRIQKTLARHADLAAFVAAIVILGSLAVIADVIVLKVLWVAPEQAWRSGSALDWPTFGWTVGPIVATVLLFSQASNFANLSALTPLYGSRLTRAYLGASNAHRLDANRRSDVTHGVVGDDLSLQGYMQSDTPAPLHLINVTRNRTVGDKLEQFQIDVDKNDPLIREDEDDPRGRLASYESGITLHDRHGDRVVFGPFGVRVGAEFFGWKDISDPPSLGLLCAVSGAAVGSGMGRQTSLGTAMALTLANVRLGYWWREQVRGGANKIRWNVLPALRCLYRELMGQFGTKDFWLLSDGGHSENSGALSLLERGCELIVVCDNGQDPTFSFADLEVFIRTARTDIGIEVSAVTEADFPKSLQHVKKYFFNGMAGDWRSRVKEQDDEAFALLLRAGDIPYRVNGEWKWRYGGESWIVWIKPNRFANLPADIATYAEMNPEFPQQSTANQFFDEAQWESYRRLGFEIGRRLFERDETLANWLPVIFGKDRSTKSDIPTPGPTSDNSVVDPLRPEGASASTTGGSNIDEDGVNRKPRIGLMRRLWSAILSLRTAASAKDGK